MADGIFSTPSLQSLTLSMDEAALRHQAISSNIANVSTPGYKRMDISATFESAFNNALGTLGDGGSVDSLPNATIETSAAQGPARPDGNTVQIEQEMVAMANNSARYEFAGQMIAQHFHGLKFAITGQG